MFTKVAALVLLFLIQLRVLHSKSVAENFRKRCEQISVKELRKLENVN